MRLTNQSKFMFQKRGVFYFSRRVPTDLRSHYNRSRIVISLRTKSHRAAITKATSLAARLDDDWLTLRWRLRDDPLQRFQISSTNEASTMSTSPLMSEAKEVYVHAKREGRTVAFVQSANRSVGYLTESFRDKPIDSYSRKEVNALRDILFERGLSRSTVKRVLNTIRAIVNFTVKEQGLNDVKTFSEVYLGEEMHNDAKKRQAIPVATIHKVQRECEELDDEARWLIALISNTGMRLSEAAGLVTSDLVLDVTHPHITLKPHPWRRLKTKGSERNIPLVGASLWAVQRASQSTSTDFLFPKYCDEDRCKSNSASGGLNKWLSPRVPEGCVVHSFRHSLRDRLRAVECPTEITDRLGGWVVSGVGEGYGNGYPVEVLYKWMKKID